MKTRYDRTIYEVARIPDGGKIGNFHFPLTLDGYRAVYKGYLADPDLQDARARWPFVAMWDNHEFSWQGWQSIQKAGDGRGPARASRSPPTRPGSNICRRASQAPSGSLDEFEPPAVKNVEIEKCDENGLGDEPNNLAAINSLIGYRAFRCGQHLDLIITDQHSYRCADPSATIRLDKLGDRATSTACSPRTLHAVLDGGRAFNGGKPPAELTFGDGAHPEPAEGRAAADHPRRRAEGLVQGPAAARRPRPGRSGAIRKARSTSAPIRRTCRPA